MKPYVLNLILGIGIVVVSTEVGAQDSPFRIDVDAEICTIVEADGALVDVACDIQSFRFSRRVLGNTTRAQATAVARFDTGADGPFTFLRCAVDHAACVIVFNGSEFSTVSCSEFLSGSSFSGRLSCYNATPLP